MSEESLAIGKATRRSDGFALATAMALAVLGVVLLWRGAQFVADMASAVAWPLSLDYGEGIVWQQLRLMLAGRGYGDISRFPYIVFHYPPVYHALAALAASVTGQDQLVAGRLLSVLATLATAALAGGLAWRAVRVRAESLPSLLCGAVTALVTLTWWPVALWAPLMRVDMVAVVLGFLGVHLGLSAFARPRLVHAAAIAFVLAVFTKQTAVAAPAATFLVLGLLRPRLALRGIATGLALGAILLGALSLATDGGFLRHVILYNINRFEPARFMIIPIVLALHPIYAMLAAMAGAAGARRLWHGRHAFRGTGWDAHDRVVAVVLAWLALSTATLLTVGKSGSDVNYLIEWMCVGGVFIGILLRDTAVLATRCWSVGAEARRDGRPLIVALVPVLLALQAGVVPVGPYAGLPSDPARMRQIDGLVERVREAQAPVVSDDMVLLLRAGKEVPWEPAIFAELASTGLWNEAPLVAMIRSHAFAFFVTVGDRGERMFDSRYTPAVADAMDAAYPRRERTAGYVLHLREAP